MSITAAKVRAPLMRLCAAPVVRGGGALGVKRGEG